MSKKKKSGKSEELHVVVRELNPSDGERAVTLLVMKGKHAGRYVDVYGTGVTEYLTLAVMFFGATAEADAVAFAEEKRFIVGGA